MIYGDGRQAIKIVIMFGTDYLLSDTTQYFSDKLPPKWCLLNKVHEQFVCVRIGQQKLNFGDGGVVLFELFFAFSLLTNIFSLEPLSFLLHFRFSVLQCQYSLFSIKSLFSLKASTLYFLSYKCQGLMGGQSLIKIVTLSVIDLETTQNIKR